MTLKRSVRIVKKVNEGGVWKFVSLERNGKCCVRDERPGTYFLDWWEAGKRRRECAGETPSQALTAQRRKQNEVAAALLLRHDQAANPLQNEPRLLHDADQASEPIRTPISLARDLFLAHVAAHSPDKPEQHDRLITAPTVNCTLRTFFYYLKNERGRRCSLP